MGCSSSRKRWACRARDPAGTFPSTRPIATLPTACVGGADPSLIISPCTGQRFRNYRNWRVECYAQVADYARERYGARVVLTGGSTAIEKAYGRDIERLSKSPPTNLIGQTSLKQLLAVLARASVVLCPDSGPAHMATAVQDAGGRAIRDVESVSHGPVCEPTPRRRQIPRSGREESSAAQSRSCAGASACGTLTR